LSGAYAYVTRHLSNEGVEESPPSGGSIDKVANGSAPNPASLFVDLSECPVAFKHWYTTPVTSEGDRLRGQGDTGGLWEWTSTALAKFEGFKAMDLYPGYTADFFDGKVSFPARSLSTADNSKHNIVLGGSWATVPRIAGRKSFVNWYQRNYPYVWATARLVRDA